MKNITNLFESTKTKVEGFISSKMNHTHMTETPVGNKRKQLLDLKRCSEDDILSLR